MNETAPEFWKGLPPDAYVFAKKGDDGKKVHWACWEKPSAIGLWCRNYTGEEYSSDSEDIEQVRKSLKAAGFQTEYFRIGDIVTPSNGAEYRVEAIHADDMNGRYTLRNLETGRGSLRATASGCAFVRHDATSAPRLRLVPPLPSQPQSSGKLVLKYLPRDTA